MVRLSILYLVFSILLLITPVEALIVAPKEWELPPPPKGVEVPVAPKTIMPTERPPLKRVEKLLPAELSPAATKAEPPFKISFSLILSFILLLVIVVLLAVWFVYPRKKEK